MRKTLTSSVVVKGIGLHTGLPSVMTSKRHYFSAQ